MNTHKNNGNVLNGNNTKASKFLCYVADGQDKDVFIADSGASQHMCFKQDCFMNYQENTHPFKVTVANGDAINAEGKGDIRVLVQIGKRKIIRILEGVWYVPKLGRNLLSVSKLAQKNYTFKANKDKCVFMKDNKPHLFGHIVKAYLSWKCLFCQMRFMLKQQIVIKGVYKSGMRPWYTKIRLM